MALNTIKALIECKGINFNSNQQSNQQKIFFEFNEKGRYYTLLEKIIENWNNEKKKIFLINFDVLFYKFIMRNIANSKEKSISLHDEFNRIIDNERNLIIFNVFSNNKGVSNFLNQIQSTNEIKNDSLFIITGLDLLPLNSIKFYFRTFFDLLLSNNLIFCSALDFSSENLKEEIEIKKLYLRNKVNLCVSEKTFKNVEKLLIYVEINNFNKLLRDVGILEYVLKENLFKFDKISIFLKEYKDIFAKNFEIEETKEEVNFF